MIVAFQTADFWKTTLQILFYQERHLDSATTSFQYLNLSMIGTQKWIVLTFSIEKQTAFDCKLKYNRNCIFLYQFIFDTCLVNYVPIGRMKEWTLKPTATARARLKRAKNNLYIRVKRTAIRNQFHLFSTYQYIIKLQLYARNVHNCQILDTIWFVGFILSVRYAMSTFGWPWNKLFQRLSQLCSL